EEVGVGAADALDGVLEPEALGEGAVDAREATLRILEVDGVGEVVHERLEEEALEAEALVGAFARGDVAEDDDAAAHLAALVAQGPSGDADEDAVGHVLVADEQLDLVGLLAAQGAGERQVKGRVG